MSDNLKFNKRLKSKFKELGLNTYSKYDNYDAIDVPRSDAIPSDYDGVCGVPVTFMTKYNPEQFEIVGSLITNNPELYSYGVPYVNGKKVYARILVKRR